MPRRKVAPRRNEAAVGLADVEPEDANAGGSEASDGEQPEGKRRRVDFGGEEPSADLVTLELRAPQEAAPHVIAKLRLECADAPEFQTLSLLAAASGLAAGLHIGILTLADARGEPLEGNITQAAVIDASSGTATVVGCFRLPGQAAALALRALCLARAPLLWAALSEAGSSSGPSDLLFAVPHKSLVEQADGSDEQALGLGSQRKHWPALVDWLLPAHRAAAHFPNCSAADRPGSSAAAAAVLSPRSQGRQQAQAQEGETGCGPELADIYAAVRPSGREPEVQGTFPGLSVSMRAYQRRAVAWMVQRETAPPAPASHPLWREVPLMDAAGSSTGERLQYNPFSGCFARGPFPPPPPVRGGILADEMGLGKTVEVLGCLMAHRFQGPRVAAASARPAPVEHVACVCGATDEGAYDGLWIQCERCLGWQHAECARVTAAEAKRAWVCGRCHATQAQEEVAEECGATLIVCPQPILAQWQHEISKHINAGALRVVTYEGQAQTRGSKAPPVTSRQLAAADVVLTTYDTLARDMWRQPDPGEPQHNLRREKRYAVLATPLTRLTWWRVCLDEAQMVENGAAAAARLASKLKAVHRWAVTGTPMRDGLGDLQGLLGFLRADPWASRQWWQRACQQPVAANDAAGWARALAVLRPELGGLFWRTSKADVAEELGLPPQQHSLTQLALSETERYWYDIQHEHVASQAHTLLDSRVMAAGSSSSDGGRQLTAAEERALLVPLLRLRQLCCHMQVGQGAVQSLKGSRGKPMTMAEILEVLIDKEKTKAEEALRALILTLNGLAALALLQGRRAAAVQAYREALRVVEAHRATARADELQQLHSLHNLAEVLQAGGWAAGEVPPTVRDSRLRQDADAIREKYMAQHWARLAAAEREHADAAAAVQRASASADGRVSPALAEGGAWWLEAVHLLQAHAGDGGEAVVQRMREQLAELTSDNTRLTRNAMGLGRRLRGPASLKMLLHETLPAMEAAGATALAELARLGQAARALDPRTVEQAGRCGRCRAELGQQGQVCAHCRLDGLLLGWEARLFSMQASALAKGGHVTAEGALQQAQAAALAKVGRGGLGEDASLAEAEAGQAGSSRRGARRGQATGGVATAEVVHHPSEAEHLLRLLLGQLRALRRLPPAAAARQEELAAEAKVQLERLEAMRRAFVRARALSLAQRQLLYAKDELEMCTSRMRLRERGEAVKAGEAHFKLHAAEVPLRVEELTADRATAEADLQLCLGRVRFLQGQRAGAVPAAAACPVCHEPLAGEFVMLPCGHTLCCGCSDVLASHAKRERQRYQCPTCRQEVAGADIGFVAPARAAEWRAAEEARAAEAAKKAAEEEPLEGDYGTKMGAVVRRVKDILAGDPGARALVFSTWAEVLDVLAHALGRNGVAQAYAKAPKQLAAALQSFRAGDTRCLLLPIKQGANGLNLTEAQHVVLVEPLPDPAVEAQALGRVHRIGQTQRTHVHSFLTQETIEQNVHALKRERAATAGPPTNNRTAKNEQRLTVRDVAVLLEKPWGQLSESGVVDEGDREDGGASPAAMQA